MQEGLCTEDDLVSLLLTVHDSESCCMQSLRKIFDFHEAVESGVNRVEREGLSVASSLEHDSSSFHVVCESLVRG